MQKLFGTDGIRGVANEWPLTPEFVTRLGATLGAVLRRDGRTGFVIIGRDTRRSGAMLENALAAGLLSQGFDTLHVGILTTPGIAFLTHARGACAGISISASHNPFQDNGIKIFGGDGYKIPDALETEIETQAQADTAPRADVAADRLGERQDSVGPIETYVDFMLDTVGGHSFMQGQRVVVDCNHGATFELAPRVLSEVGAEVIDINAEPDGININRGYNALEPRALRDAVLQTQAAWGVQFDGDGDRAVFVDGRGEYFDGDYVLTIVARDLAGREALPSHTVVSTVMANLGLEKVLAGMGLQLERTPVGDRWVTERMRAIGAPLGGEQSGHIVFLDGGHTTGDGLYTTLRLAEIMARHQGTLAELAEGMRKYPQVLVNVPVPRKPPLEQFPEIQDQVARSQALLGDGARIVLRYSGTENLARVMIEGNDQASITREANAIAHTIQHAITERG